jgi:hypothetical protein
LHNIRFFLIIGAVLRDERILDAISGCSTIENRYHMKKLICILLFLFPVVAFTQSNQPTSKSIRKIQGRIELAGKTTSEIHCGRNLNQALKPQTPQQGSLIQIIDSVYNWQLDLSNWTWKVYNRYNNYVYDANKNLISYIVQSWNDTVWAVDKKYIYTYDANHNQTSESDQIWNGSNWVTEDQYIYTYDANNNQISELKQYRTDSVMTNEEYFLYTYDANNNKTSGLFQSWNNGTWVNIWQYIYTYNTSNYQTSELTKIWLDSVWSNDFQDLYTYDANHNQTSELLQDWDISGVWLNSEQYTFTYDANNNQTSKLVQTWNDSTWMNYVQYNFTYDANNNQTSESDQNWYNSAWANQWQETSTYDVNNFKKSDVIKFWSGEGVFLIGGDSTYYYFHTFTGINELKLQDAGITIYPNPAKDKCKVQCANCNIKSIEIFSLTGEKVYGAEFPAGAGDAVEVDLDFPSGIYFVRVMDEKGISVQKLVVE